MAYCLQRKVVVVGGGGGMEGITERVLINQTFSNPDCSNVIISCQGNSQSQPALSQSQPATQPLEFSQESLAQVASQGPEDGVWGQLFPYSGTFPR